MKNRSIFLLAALMLTSVFARATDGDSTTASDTIEVNFGDNGKILIHVESKEDLDALKEYDLNSMLEDVNVPVKGDLKDNEKVILQDDEGTRYLKDSVEEDAEFRELENEFSANEDDDEDEIKEYNYERDSRTFSGSKTTWVSGFDFGINNLLEDGDFRMTTSNIPSGPGVHGMLDSTPPFKHISVESLPSIMAEESAGTILNFRIHVPDW